MILKLSLKNKITKGLVEDAIREEFSNKDYNLTLKTGICQLDSAIGGFRRGELYLLVGCGCSGKTSFLLNMINSIGINQGKTIVYFSLEDGIILSIRKLLRIMSGRSLADINTEEMDQMVINLSNKNIYIDDTPAISTDRITESLNWFNQPVDMVIIDYLQLVKGYDSESTSAEIMNALKVIAQTFNCPVLVPYTLNSLIGYKDKACRYLQVPEISNRIADIVDNILFIMNTSYTFSEDGSEKTPETRFLVGKNRRGSAKEFYLERDTNNFIFRDIGKL